MPIVLGKHAVPVLREVIVNTAGLRKGCRLSYYEIRNIVSGKITPEAERASLTIFVILGSIDASIGTAEVQFVTALDPSHVFLYLLGLTGKGSKISGADAKPPAHGNVERRRRRLCDIYPCSIKSIRRSSSRLSRFIVQTVPRTEEQFGRSGINVIKRNIL